MYDLIFLIQKRLNKLIILFAFGYYKDIEILPKSGKKKKGFIRLIEI